MRLPLRAQVNYKAARLNLLRCFACTTHFCYLCRQALRQKPGQHFRKGGHCQLHTND
jgi:hypothetical protein